MTDRLGEHRRSLVRMYVGARVNARLSPVLRVDDGAAEVEWLVDEDQHHAAGAAHGAIVFKALDDAAFFAAQSVETRRFVLTVSFALTLVRPIVSGPLRATGRLLHPGGSVLVAAAEAHDGEGRLLATGQGTFLRGGTRLVDVPGYLAEG